MSNGGEEMRFKGVRKRKWGKYVAEIRSGKRSRISLGSYFTPEAAARAYDTALLCLRGPNALFFNFPDSQFNSTALDVAAAHGNPSPNVIRTAAITVGFSFDTVPARYHDNVEAGPSADKEASIHFGQGVDDQDTALFCLRGPHASSFNFPDSQFNSTALEVAAAHSNPSPESVRTAAIAVGSSFYTIPARCYDNVEAKSSAGREAATHFGQGVDDQQIGDKVEEEEDICELNDLLLSPEEISFEERVQMSLHLPEQDEMMQPCNSSEIFPDLGTSDETTFQATPAKPPT